MYVSRSWAPEPTSPRGRLTSAPLLFTLLGPDVCFFYSPLISWAYWVMIAHRHPVTEDVSWLSGIWEAPAESTVSAQTRSPSNTHMRSISTSFVCIHKSERKKVKKYSCKNTQGDIYCLLQTSWNHKLRQIVCWEWHQILSEDSFLSGCLHLQQMGPYISVMHCRS